MNDATSHLCSLTIDPLTQGAVIGIDHEDDTTFTITVDGKMFHFQGMSYMNVTIGAVLALVLHDITALNFERVVLD